MDNRIFSAFAMLAFVFSACFAQTSGEFEVRSEAMDKDVKNYAVLPASYAQDTQARYPVVYLLHGFGGNHLTWPKQTKKNLQQISDSLGIIFISPDGARSWYWDSPVDPKIRYETYVSKELISAVDAKFRTIADRRARAITGFSMGGHGGLWLGFRHPDAFASCGSLSGGVDIRPFPENWDMAKNLGEYYTNEEVWDSHTVINQLFRVRPNSLNIIIDCGYADFFYDVNQALHKKMRDMRINHEYTVRPGAHTHDYWDDAIDYQIMYFSKCFRRMLAPAEPPAEKK